MEVGERRTSDFRVADVVSVVTEEVPAQVGYRVDIVQFEIQQKSVTVTPSGTAKKCHCK